MLSLCCSFGICFYCSLFFVILCCFYSVVFCMMQRYFVFAFVPFWCYCVIFTHINIIPFLYCVRTQTKLNCVRTQCVIFCPGI